MKPSRLLAYLIGCVAFISSLLVYMTYIEGLGFPDGFITELGYAERRLAYIFIGLSVAWGAGFVYLGVAGARKATGKKLSAAVILYLISVIGIALLDYYYRLHLDNGVGG